VSFGGYRGKRRDDVSHGLTARRVTHGAAVACAAHGADVVACRQRRCEVVAMAAQLSRVRDANVRAPFKRPLSLTGGPQCFYLFIKIFKHPHFDIQFGDLLDV
jgi:hypothetical protein